MKYIVPVMLLALSGCSKLPFWGGDPSTDEAAPMEVAAPVVEETPVATPVAPVAVAAPPIRPKLTLPTAAAPPPEPAGFGTTVASLGNVAEPGLWLKTPLVTTRQQGRVTAANGQSATVELIPIDGPDTAGSRISFAAMQALGLPITDLPELSVAPL